MDFQPTFVVEDVYFIGIQKCVPYNYIKIIYITQGEVLQKWNFAAKQLDF